MEGIALRMFVEEGSPTRSAPTLHRVEPEASSADPAALEAGNVAKARRGDEASFRWLFLRFYPMVHAVALAHGAKDDVDDVCQDVFLAAWRALPELRSDDHFGGWIAQIARHRAARTTATRNTRRVTPLERDVAAKDSNEASAEDLLVVLRSLPPAYRETLALRLIEGLSGPEIAALTGLTHGSVRVNLTRGMELLREALRERGWT